MSHIQISCLIAIPDEFINFNKARCQYSEFQTDRVERANSKIRVVLNIHKKLISTTTVVHQGKPNLDLLAKFTARSLRCQIASVGTKIKNGADFTFDFNHFCLVMK